MSDKVHELERLDGSVQASINEAGDVWLGVDDQVDIVLSHDQARWLFTCGLPALFDALYDHRRKATT